MTAKRKRTTLTPNSFDTLKEKCLVDPAGATETIRLAVNLLSENPKHVANALNHLLKKTHDPSNDFVLGEGGQYLIEGVCMAFWRCVSGFWDEGVDYEGISKYMSEARHEQAVKDKVMKMESSNGDDESDIFQPIHDCWDMNFANDYLKKWVQLCRARIFGASSPKDFVEGSGKLDLVLPSNSQGIRSGLILKMIRWLIVVDLHLEADLASAGSVRGSHSCPHVSEPCPGHGCHTAEVSWGDTQVQIRVI